MYRLLKLPSGRIAETGNYKRTGPTLNLGTTATDHYNEELVNICGVIFDMDGTLTLPVYDGKELLQRLPLPSDTEDVLNAIWKLEEPEKSRLIKIVEQYEEEKKACMKLQPNLVKLLHFVSSNNVKIALLTRNVSESVKHFLSLLQTEVETSVLPEVHSIFSPVSVRGLQRAIDLVDGDENPKCKYQRS